MRRKSIEEVTSPAKPDDSLSGIARALNHAAHMHRSGYLSDAERDAFRALAAAEGMEHIGLDDVGMVNKLQEMGGYGDDEDPGEADAHRHAVGAKVVVHFFADAAKRGIIKPKEALEAIKTYAALPEADDDSHAIEILLEHASAPDNTLPAPGGGEEMSDEELDAALDKMYRNSTGLRYEPAMREVGMPAAHERSKKSR